jgi:hypothetical protein
MLVVCVDNVVHEIFFNMILDVGQLLEIINNIFLIFFQYAQFFKISLSLWFFLMAQRTPYLNFFLSCKFENLCFDAMNWKNEYV